MLYGKLQNLLTDEVIDVHATTDSPDSSYGFLCWVDKDGSSYGQIQFFAPFGFRLLEVWEKPDKESL